MVKHTIQTKLLVIVTGLLFISLFVNFWWVYLGQKGSNNVIDELNRGAEIDFEYVNKVNDTSGKLYELWESCNATLSKELKGNISDDELKVFLSDYTEKVNAFESAYDETTEMKKNRSEEFAKFKYVNVYRP